MFRVWRRPKRVYYSVYPVPHQDKPEKFPSAPWTVDTRVWTDWNKQLPQTFVRRMKIKLSQTQVV